MLTVSKKVEYSLVLLSYLAKGREAVVGLKAAALELGLPYRFLSQLAAAMRRGGVLNSKEGKLGGYSLAAGWEEKNLYQLMEILGESRPMVACLDGRSCRRLKECSAKVVWERVETGLKDSLRNVRLGEI